MTDADSTLRLHTTWGVITVTLSGGMVTACDLPLADRRAVRSAPEVTRIDERSVRAADRSAARAAARFVTAALQGRTEAPFAAVRWSGGTALQQAVWRYLHGMGRGQVVSYGELARAIGRPRAARAVGQACGANPLPLFVPCHRVLAAHGRLGGFSGGLAWKEWLLSCEALTLPVRRGR